MKDSTSKYENIDQYIGLFSGDIKDRLVKIRETIKEIIPEATETIKYQMPTFFLFENLIHFAAFKNHIGLYPTPSGIEAFKKELAKYITTKGAIQFPNDMPIPYNLIKRIVKFRVRESIQKEIKNIKQIAPCGMNCKLCIAFQREENKCPGCLGPDIGKSPQCVNCRIKNCEELKKTKTGFCYSCLKFPCEKIKHIDKRYRTKYRMSMIENLKKIERIGLDKFIKAEDIKWKCGDCGELLCVHRGECVNCKNLNI